MSRINYSRKFTLIQRGDSNIIVTGVSLEILLALKTGSQFTYDELHEHTGIPVCSLYVFCQRLEQAKFIKRVKRMSGSPRRERTYVKLTSKNLEFLPVTIVGH